MLKREALGMACLSLVVGLLVVGLIPRPESGPALSLVSSTIPDRFLRSVGSRPILSLGLVSNRDATELKLCFSAMIEVNPGTWLKDPGTWVREEELLDGRTGLIPIDIWLGQAAGFGLGNFLHKGSASVNGTDYRAYVYDFRDVSGSSPCMAVFAVLFDEGNLSKAYWGPADVFVERETTVASFRLDLGNKAQLYSSEPEDAERGIQDLPAHGQFTVLGLSKDEQVFASMTLRGHLVPSARSWLWVCRGEVDGTTGQMWIFWVP